MRIHRSKTEPLNTNSLWVYPLGNSKYELRIFGNSGWQKLESDSPTTTQEPTTTLPPIPQDYMEILKKPIYFTYVEDGKFWYYNNLYDYNNHFCNLTFAEFLCFTDLLRESLACDAHDLNPTKFTYDLRRYLNIYIVNTSHASKVEVLDYRAEPSTNMVYLYISYNGRKLAINMTVGQGVLRASTGKPDKEYDDAFVYYDINPYGTFVCPSKPNEGVCSGYLIGKYSDTPPINMPTMFYEDTLILLRMGGGHFVDGRTTTTTTPSMPNPSFVNLKASMLSNEEEDDSVSINKNEEKIEIVFDNLDLNTYTLHETISIEDIINSIQDNNLSVYVKNENGLTTKEIQASSSEGTVIIEVFGVIPNKQATIRISESDGLVIQVQPELS